MYGSDASTIVPKATLKYLEMIYSPKSNIPQRNESYGHVFGQEIVRTLYNRKKTKAEALQVLNDCYSCAKSMPEVKQKFEEMYSREVLSSKPTNELTVSNIVQASKELKQLQLKPLVIVSKIPNFDNLRPEVQSPIDLDNINF